MRGKVTQWVQLQGARHGHGWCLGSDFLAQGYSHNHPDCKPMWASPPVIFTMQERLK